MVSASLWNVRNWACSFNSNSLFSPQASDQQILVDFYNGLDDRGVLVWNPRQDLCGQTGVYCTNGAVEAM